jgi:nitric oxide reductase NorE protein
MMKPQGASNNDAARPKAPGIWIFISLDCTSFGVLFLVFMVERFTQSAAFNQSAQILDVRLGFANTLILITSSFLVARATCSAHDREMVASRRWLASAFVLASGFGAIKAIEYTKAISNGVADLSDEFFTFYFALTGVHLVHYLIGMVVLAYLVRQLGADAGVEARSRYLRLLDGGALFWHMVDLLWVYIFAMLYLIGAR